MKFSEVKNLTKDQCENGTVFAPKFDDKGLIMAIASDRRTNEVLMVAYMNEQALSLTLTTGIVHYFSRSRQSLWKKGETSGETQRLVTMRTDCDQDVLLLSVEQTGRGAACHTGHKSCFYRKVELKDGKAELSNDKSPLLFNPSDVYKSSN